MKDFHTWIGDMADKYVDDSVVIKGKCSCGNTSPVVNSQRLTALQKRAMWADLEVPCVTSYIDATLWLKALCTSMGGVVVRPSDRIGKTLADAWAEISKRGDDAEAVEFIKKVKGYIGAY